MLKLAQVKAHQQETEWSCSAACLKAAALHFGIDLTEKATIKAVGARKGRGAETDEIVAGAKKLGFESWEKSFKDLNEAKAMLKRGIPIIADFQSFNHPGKGHYVLIAGFKPGMGFLIMDPNTKGKTAVANWRILSAKEMEDKWWDRAMAPPHKLMSKWGVMIMSKQKEKVAWSGTQAINRAKSEAASSQHAFGKQSAGDDEEEKIPLTSPRWGALAGGGAGMALGSISGAQTGVIAQRLRERAQSQKSGRLAKLVPKTLRNFANIPRRMDAATRGGTYGAAVGIPLGAALGYKLMQPGSQEKKANGDMMEYFQKHPKKREEYEARQAAKKKGKTKKANDPIKKKLKIHGINIWLEWLKGEERTYYNHDPLKVKSKGKLDYKTKMKADYGYIPKRYDADGEDLDVYLGPNHESSKVFILKQIRPSDGSFDEHKIMIGYDSQDEAKKSYLAHMPKKYLGSIRTTDINTFKKEFLLGKARFKKKADAKILGILGGGALGYAASKAKREAQDEAGVPIYKKTSPVFNTAMGAWSGADIVKHLRDMKATKARGGTVAANKYLRNPMIGGALLAGGLSAGLTHRANKKAKQKGTKSSAGPVWTSAALNALHGASLGGSIGTAVGTLGARRAPVAGRGANDRTRSARQGTSSGRVPDWAEGAKTQKEVQKRYRDMARKHHSDLGAKGDDVMKRVNSEMGDFRNSAKFKGMAKEAALRAFANELQRIMEANAIH